MWRFRWGSGLLALCFCLWVLGTAQPVKLSVVLAGGGIRETQRERLWHGGNKPGAPEVATPASAVRQIQDEFLQALTASGIRYSLNDRLTVLLNAVVITVQDETDVQKLQALPHVDRLFRVTQISAPKSLTLRRRSSAGNDSVLPQLLPHALTGVSAVHQLGLNGSSVRVGIIDTGLDGTHPAFAGKVAVWRNYVDGAVGKNSTQPIDCGRGGHGTRVAGIVAGQQGAFVGVAPGVQLGVYRVYDCNGNGESTSFSKALEDAIKDGMNVINLSMGSADPWNVGTIALSVDAIVNTTSAIVVGAAGNDGGLFTVNSPGTARNVLSVASFDSHFVLARQLLVNGKDKVDFLFSTSNPPTQSDLKSDVVIVRPFEGPKQKFDQGTCFDPQALAPRNTSDADMPTVYANKTLVVFQSLCTYDVLGQIATSAASLGAQSVIFVLATDDLGSTNARWTMTDAPPTIKWLKVGRTEGERMFGSGQPSKTPVPFAERKMAFVVSETDRVVANMNYDGISWFSSFGPTAYFDLKPEIAAFGGAVYTTFPMSQGGFGFDDGTSFAAPYISGVVALLQQRLGKDIGLSTMRSLLMDNATPGFLKSTPHPQTRAGVTSEVPIPVQGQGAGLVNALRALKASVAVEPYGIELPPIDLPSSPSDPATSKPVNSPHGVTYLANLSLRNRGKQAVTYRIKHLPAAAVNESSAILGTGQDASAQSDSSAPLDTRSYVQSPAQIAFSAVTVTIPPQQTVNVSLTIVPDPKTRDMGYLFSGFVQLVPLQPAIGYRTMSVPYTGYNGRLSNVPLFPRDALKFSLEVNGDTAVTYPSPFPAVIKFNVSDPANALRIDYTTLMPSRQLYLDVYAVSGTGNKTKEQWIGWLSRDVDTSQLGSTARWNSDNYQVMRWDNAANRPAPVALKVPGRYRLKLSSWWGRQDVAEEQVAMQGRQFIGPIVELH
ncbi:hypothetical protein RI367_003251 [Sorochytrium milnesiophthora]